MILPTEFLVYVAELLERLGIPYHVGGSVASSAHGMYRASADIDFVIDPTSDQLEALARALEPAFYVSRSAMAEALAHRSTFNAIHDQTSFKLDFFIKGATPFDAEELRRSIRQTIGQISPAAFEKARATQARKLTVYGIGTSPKRKD